MGVDRPLGLFVGDDRAVETVPMEWIKSPSTWISCTDEAFQAEATRYSSHSFPLVFRGVQGFSSSSPSCQKRAAKGVRSCGCGSGTEVVEVDVSICSLNMVLADGSAAMSSYGEERTLVMVGETSLEESNSLR